MSPVIKTNIRLSEGGMNSCRTNFDGHGRIQCSNSHLEWLESDVLIGENAKLSSFTDTDSDTTWKAVLVRTEPSVALGLLEDVMQDSIVSVVIHGSGH